ncbi:MAG TPA: DUF6152 family protein [Vicinamibacterales bacterium]|nr:DUF6152 family protein [Vicinamibacterales bacterium]
MTRQHRVYLAVALGATCIAGVTPLRAHHSHGNYSDAFIDVEGVVKEVHFVNPHSWIYIEVKGPNGQPQKWSLEASSVIQLERIGVTRDYVKAGDPIKARCHPLRDGSRGCLLGFVKARDGSVKDWDSNNLPIPTDF